MKVKSNELDLFEILKDWTNVSETTKKEILREHTQCVSLSRQVVGASSSYNTNMRSLTMMLFSSLALVLLGVENKTIVLLIVGMQFVKTLFSKLLELNVNTALEVAKNNFIQLLKRKSMYL